MLKRFLIAFSLVIAFVLPISAGSKGASSGSSKGTKSKAEKKKASRCVTCARDAKGKIVRSEAAKKDFETQTGYPKGRKGYVVDHINPLECGGADVPSNMRWQTTAEAKAKDKTERSCRR